MGQPKRTNADYFSHDADMRNDIKIKALRRQFGNEGYAIWCYILESLTNADDFEIEYTGLNQELMAADFDITTERLNEIVAYCTKIGLLQISDDILFCEAHKRRFAELQDNRQWKSEVGRQAALTKWEKIRQAKNADANAMRTQSNAEETDANAMRTQSNAEETDANAMRTQEEMLRTQSNAMRFDAKREESRVDKKEKFLKSRVDKKEKFIKRKNFDLDAIDPAYREIVETWLEYKAEKRESYKGNKSLQAFVKKLRNLSGDDPQKAAAIIEQSMANNYSGIFELKESRQQPRRQYGGSEDSTALSNPQGVSLGVGEWITGDGRRTYGLGNLSIPLTAPPRPGENFAWNGERNAWDILI